MFEIRIMVEDNKLTKLLHALDGLIAGMPQIVPVRGAVVIKTTKGTKVKAKFEGSIRDRVSQALDELQVATCSFADISRLVNEAGGSKGSIGVIIKYLTKNGRISKIGHGKYQINPTI